MACIWTSYHCVEYLVRVLPPIIISSWQYLTMLSMHGLEYGGSCHGSRQTRTLGSPELDVVLFEPCLCDASALALCPAIRNHARIHIA